MRRTVVTILVMVAFVVTERSANGQAVLAKDSATERVQRLMAEMTLEEKLGQLTLFSAGKGPAYNPTSPSQRQKDIAELIGSGKVGAVLNAHGAEYTNDLQRTAVEKSRLHIPLLFGNDVIHGYRTIFPIPLGESASWDLALIERAARIAAIEASSAGTHWTFAPMVDIARDPRWGRIAEGAGEDPYLGSAIAAARVRGFQGTDLKSTDTILACAKHLAAYGAAEGGRDYNTVDISPQTLREVYLPPFKAAVDAGAETLMSAFNDVNGVPATGSHLLMSEILRGEWGFDGFVVSDWDSVEEMIDHRFAADKSDAAAKALTAGLDMDMSSFSYLEHLADALRDGRVTQAQIDTAVRRVLEAKSRLGLFERPYADPQRERALILNPAHRAVAREMARNSIVLLKNEGDLLPIKKSVESIAVIGPLADDRNAPLGTWAVVGQATDVVTVLAGIKLRAPDGMMIRHVQGCDVDSDRTDGLPAAVEAARQSDLAILVVGESADMSGEAHCRTTLDLPGVQQQLVQAVHETGVPTVVVLLHGRPLSIGWTAEQVPAILATWHLGVECGPATADVLFGDFNPGGKLPVTFPRAVGQVPIYYNHRSTGRPPQADDRFTSKYIDLPWTPLYPFGFGLSYTKFEFTNLKIEPRELATDGAVRISVDIRNAGGRAGTEVVQLYVRDLVAGMTRPVKELKGFEKVALDSGEAQSVSFTLKASDLGFYDRDERYVVEPGKFAVWVGPNSAEGLQGEFELTAK
jgi:beta-glucosidase